MTATAAKRADAFAPGHVTGLFAPGATARDPRARGSIGAGVVLELGVHASAVFVPGPVRSLRVRSDLGTPLPISEEVARRLRPRRSGRITVRLVHELPVGQGFGMSAAGAAATALAVGTLAGRSTEKSIEVAHLADLFGGGGLGGVAAIAGGGGLEFRTRAGLPPWGRTTHRTLDGSLFLGVVGGPLASPTLLSSPRFMARVSAASAGLGTLLRHPDPDAFFAASERFTDRLGLVSPPLRRVLAGLRREGGWAAQSMFGRSFFARPKRTEDRAGLVRWLERARIAAVEVRASRSGARPAVSPATARANAAALKQPF